MQSRKIKREFGCNLLLASSIVIISLSTCNSAAQAAVSANDIVSVVEKAKILSSGTRVAAAINGSEVYVSTYKNARATDNDCKIEAVLVAKTAMDLAPNEISRATVYFYSTANINKRKFVTVTAGDVKAFGSGQLGQEQLLSSLTVKDEEVSDPAARMNTYLQQRETLRNRRKFDAQMNGTTMIVVADLDPLTTERDMKYEAFKIAEKALEGGSGAKSVQVSFTDPTTRGTVQQISFDDSQIKAINASIQNALSNIQMASVTSKVDVQSLTAIDGDEQENRNKILTMIKNLDKQGVGVTPFLIQFYAIEKLAQTDNNPQLRPAVTGLLSALTEQESRSKNAKDFKPVGNAAPKKEAVEETANEENLSSGKKTRTSRWAGGTSAMTDGEILKDPDKAIETQANTMGGVQKAEQNQKFALCILHASEVLSANNRTADAQRIMKRYADLKAKNHW
ncbi:MAG: hypothetical protein KGS72_06460 [Cyanobacteria bacterium REEB67]|nr:hypothetical protein [Cyanobacteria bacterium REEB67]